MRQWAEMKQRRASRRTETIRTLIAQHRAEREAAFVRLQADVDETFGALDARLAGIQEGLNECGVALDRLERSL